MVPESNLLEEAERGEMKVEYATNKDGVKLLQLFTGDDIFAHHEE